MLTLRQMVPRMGLEQNFYFQFNVSIYIAQINQLDLVTDRLVGSSVFKQVNCTQLRRPGSKL